MSEYAQRIKAPPEETFWPDISLDLTGAILVDLSLDNTSVVHAAFNEATFSGYAGFDGATFSGYAGFDQATFSGYAVFDQATFSEGAWFDEATFSEGAWFDQVQVLHVDDPSLNEIRKWPDGWTVRPDADDPTRGTLVPSAAGADND